MLLVFRYILSKNTIALALWPFIILRNHDLKEDKQLLNHEEIHLQQQLEMGIIFFYLWYIVEFLWLYMYHKNSKIAYRSISFEREAYENDHDLHYLKKRARWSFLNYI